MVFSCCCRLLFKSEMKAMVGSSVEQDLWKEHSQRHMSKSLAIMARISNSCIQKWRDQREAFELRQLPSNKEKPWATPVTVKQKKAFEQRQLPSNKKKPLSYASYRQAKRSLELRQFPIWGCRGCFRLGKSMIVIWIFWISCSPQTR